MIPADPNTILITCAKGVADLLRVEVEALGYTVDSQHETGVMITAGWGDVMRLNLHLRTAYNVLWLLKSFDCRSPKRLYNRVQTVPWEELIPPDGYLSVVSKVETPSVDNSMFANVRVKDAIVDRMNEIVGRRPDSGPERNGIVVNLYWRDHRAWLYLNTSGIKLSDRSYRKLPHDAPMQESLAAAVMLATGYDGSQPLLCPMCGSGTLAIEAALIAAGRAPGLLRTHFGFTKLKTHDEELWQALRREAQKISRKNRPSAPIIASDLSTGAVQAARKNAMTAGVEHRIEFRICDFAETPVPDQPGLIVMNPEYGKRMGETDALAETYRRIGDFFKQRCPGWTGYLFTGNLELAKQIGLRASRRMPFWNAEIECRLLKYELYRGSQRTTSERPTS